MSEDFKKKIKQYSQEYLREITAIRRYLHQHPELSFKEVNTSEFIAEKLSEFGIPYNQGIAGTGLVGLIEGRNPASKVIALRADMDALPILEKNDVPYKSKNDGVMHACGHDVHMSSLIGASKILNKLKDEFEGTIKLIFQPAEELFPGGASIMIREGVLENPSVSRIYGQHVYPQMEAGKVGFKSGLYMASADEVYLRVKGIGGHGAYPHLTIDPVLIASHIVVALQQVVSRNVNPTMPAVLSFGRIIGEGATNVIPAEVVLDGTLRTFDEKVRSECHINIRRIAEGMAKSMGADCEVEINIGYPCLVNDDDLTLKSKERAIQYMGKENVEDLDMRMGAEDFAYFSQATTACFYRLGISNKSKGLGAPLHTPIFDVDEKSLETGMGLMAWLAVSELMN